MSGLYVSLGEGLTFLIALFGLGALVGIGEGLRALGVAVRTTRRLVHTGVSLFVVVTPFLFSRPLPVYGLAGLFVLLNAGARSWEWWASIHEARPESWGTVALPLAVFPALAATWSIGAERVFVLQASFLILAVADPLASVLGETMGRRRLVADATWTGSGVFFGTSFVLAGSVLLWAVPWRPGRIVRVALLVALVATPIEAIGQRGWDNFFVVIGVVLVLVPLSETPDAAVSLGLTLLLGAGVAGAAYWSGALNETGAIGSGLFAASLVGLGGWAWAVPGFAFFVLSSALSWLPDLTGELGADEGPGRTLRQVLANGGIAWGFLGASAVLPVGQASLQTICYAGFLGALAAAAADTWATELGVRGAGAPHSLRTFRRVPPGTSGAVSLVGTAAAALGAASVAGAAVLVEGAGGAWLQMGCVALAGLAGMAVDSLAGAFLQARYRDPETGRLVEDPVPRATRVCGWVGVDNEIVNVMGTAAGAAMAIVLRGGIG